MLIRKNMFVVGVHYCVQLLSEETFLRLIMAHQQWLIIKDALLKPHKNSTQTIFQGSSPWATLILNSMFVLGSTIVSSCCLRWKCTKSFSPFLVLSFANTFLFFYFLSPILLEFSKSLISQNIGCLLKPNKQNSTQTIFQGGSPWATLILNSMFALGVLYCVQLLPEVKKNIHSFYPFLC